VHMYMKTERLKTIVSAPNYDIIAVFCGAIAVLAILSTLFLKESPYLKVSTSGLPLLAVISNVDIIALGMVAISILWVFLLFKTIYSKAKKEACRREKELEALNEVALAVGRSLDLDKVLDNALKSVVKIGNFDVGFVYLLNQDKNVLEIAAAYGEIPKTLAAKLSTLHLGQEV